MHSSTEPTLPMTVRTHSKVPSNAELDAIELADCGHLADNQGGTSEPQSLPPIAIGSRTPKTPDELESSAPVTPIHRTAVTGIVPGWGYPTMNKWRVLACCLIYFGNGMNDSAPGALIPYMETYYHIDYAIVSMIWVANAAGFISAAFFVDLFRDRLGRAKTLMLAEAVISAGCVLIVCSPPYPAVVVAYFLVGYGTAVNLALNSVFSANLANATVILGVTNGCYGIGGILGPFVATALVSNGVLWSRFFLVVLTIRIVCFFFAGWSFWNYEKEGVTQFANSLQLIASRQAASEYGEPSKLKLLSRALKNKTTIIGALFIFAYQGGEVAESGWFISYLIDYRNGDPAHVGYVTSGFWAGITLGRFVLVHLAHRIGEKKSVFALGAGVIGLQLVAWLVRDVIGDAGKPHKLRP